MARREPVVDLAAVEDDLGDAVGEGLQQQHLAAADRSARPWPQGDDAEQPTAAHHRRGDQGAGAAAA